MKGTLHIEDYIVFCAGIMISLLAGAYYAYKERNHASQFRFHRADGKLKALPTAISLLVTFESSIFFLGYPAEVYVHGFIFWLANVGIAIGFSALLWLTIPLFYPLQITSVFEYLQMRHETIYVRRLTMFLRTIAMTVYAAIVVYGAALALETVVSIPAWVFIIAISAAAVIYTSLGGIKAIVVADVIQAVIMNVTVVIVLIYGTMRAGGIDRVIQLNKSSGRLRLIDFDPNPLTRHTFWTLIIGNAVQQFGIAWHPACIQRFNSVRTIGEARNVAFIVIPLFTITNLLVMSEGLVAYAYFANKRCDPLASGTVSNANQIIPYTIVEMFSGVPGMTGLFLAGLCSASLSTISSMLGSISAIISQDFVKSAFVTLSDKTLTNVSKLTVVVFGTFCVVVSVGISYIKGPMSQIAGSITGSLSGPIMAVFLLSIFTRSATRTGIYASAVVGFVFAVWITVGYSFSPGRKVTPWLPLGPTDKCNTTLIRFEQNNQSGDTMLLECSQNYSADCEVMWQANVTPNTKHLELDGLHGLDYLYSISYCYHQLLVTIVAMIVGVVVSMVTSDRPIIIPKHLIITLNRAFFTCKPRKDSIDTEMELSVPITHPN